MVLEELSKLAKSLNWDNEMKLFSGYNYLLKGGYLSQEHQFYFLENADWCQRLLGNNIMLGLGNCKHINSMLKDLLNINGYSSYNLSMLLDNDVFPLSNIALSILDTDKEVDKEVENEVLEVKFNSLLMKLYLESKYFTNHVVTLFVDDEHSYVMDGCNDTIYFVDDELRVYQNEYYFNTFYNEWYNDEKLKLRKILKPSSAEMLKSRLVDYYEVLGMCSECVDIFEKFYCEHKELYKEVVEKRKVLMREFGKYDIYRRK